MKNELQIDGAVEEILGSTPFITLRAEIAESFRDDALIHTFLDGPIEATS